MYHDTGKKLPRPEHLEGRTYRIDPPDYNSAMYITVNDFVDEQGRKRPFEVFIAKKGHEDQGWITALTLVISAVFRRPGNYEMVMEELESVVDPKGGYWLPNGGGRMESVVAHIGRVIRQHIEMNQEKGYEVRHHPSAETPADPERQMEEAPQRAAL